MTVEVLTSARSTMLTVDEVVQETADAITIILTKPEDHRFTHRPGQFLTLRVPSDRTEAVARCYSLCSTPDDDRLAVTVKRTSDGYASNWLCDNVSAGTHLEVLPPSGAFVPTSLDEDLLLIGGGSGITPLMSILRTTLEAGSGRVVLIYANHDPASVIFAQALRDLMARHPDRLTVIHWLNALQGLPTVATLSTVLRPYAALPAFICGPAPFMETARTALAGLGVPRDRIHIEHFQSLSGDPFADHETDLAAAVATDDDPADLTVILDGATHHLEWPRSLTLIDLLVANDIEAPYSCREGECGSCVCSVVDGTVKMARSDTLDPADIADGYILGCQSRPTSDLLVIEF